MPKPDNQTTKSEMSSSGHVALSIAKVFLKVTSIIILVIALIIVAYFVLATLFNVIDRANFEIYLKDKYSEDFKIETMRVNGAMIGDPGQLIGVAYPVDNKNLVFEVFKNRKKGVYSDEYSGAVWSEEERPVVTSFLKTIYGERDMPNFALNTRLYANVANPIYGKVPNINIAMDKYKDIFVYEITIKLSINNKHSQGEIENHLTKIKQIADFVISKNIASPGVRYAINIKDHNEGYLCDLYKDQFSSLDSIDSCLKYNNRRVW